jgi:hypothetical protein
MNNAVAFLPGLLLLLSGVGFLVNTMAGAILLILAGVVLLARGAGAL